MTGVFELAGAGRAFAAAGDSEGAMTSLSRVAWLALWEKAVVAAAERVAATVNACLEEAAAESRFPRRRLRTALLTPDDTRAIARAARQRRRPLRRGARRAGAGGAGGDRPAARRGSAAAAWRGALAAVARRLEAAWLALEQAAVEEQRRWQVDVERIRAWRLPRWPLWLLTAVVLAAATYLGLVLGGYVRVPPALEGFAEFWWSRL